MCVETLTQAAVNQMARTVTPLLYHPAEHKHKYFKKSKKTLGEFYSTNTTLHHDKFLSHFGHHPSLSSHLEAWAHQLV